MWEELLKDVEIIKWTVICMAVSLWGLTAYFFLKAVPEWWHGSNKKKEKKPFTLEQMKKDLEGSTRPRRGGRGE